MKKKIAILTLDPYNYGGVLSLMQAFWQFAEIHFEPKLFYLSYEADISSHFKKGKFFAARKDQTLFNMPGTAIGVWMPRWEPGNYWFNRRQWAQALEGYDYCVVVSGNPIAAHPLVQLKKKFMLWVATPFEDDRVQRTAQLTSATKITDRLSRFCIAAIERKILTHASQVLGLSQYAADRFNEITDSQKAVVCGYPMALQPYEEGKRPPILMAAGRWTDPRKNVAMLLEAFDHIYAKRPDSQLHVFGQKPELASYASGKKSMQAVTFHGYADAQVLQAMYAQAQVFLIPSHQEGFGIVGLEAMSRGVPVISTACGGPQDFVSHGKNGYLVPINDATAMAHNALTILGNETLQRELAVGARATIEQKFLPPIIQGQLQQALVQTYPELEGYFQ